MFFKEFVVKIVHLNNALFHQWFIKLNVQWWKPERIDNSNEYNFSQKAASN